MCPRDFLGELEYWGLSALHLGNKGSRKNAIFTGHFKYRDRDGSTTHVNSNFYFGGFHKKSLDTDCLEKMFCGHCVISNYFNATFI